MNKYVQTNLIIWRNGRIPDYMYLIKIWSWRNRKLEHPIKTIEVELVIKSLPTKESPEQMASCWVIRNIQTFSIP
jgi:hypothetical protein